MRKYIFAILPLIAALMLACEPDRNIDYQYPPASEDTTSPVVDTLPNGKERPIRKPGPATVTVEPEFCRPGEACDIAGPRVLAERVDPSLSTFQIKALKFYAAGDPVAFIVCARDKERQPVVGAPVVVLVKATARQLAGDGLTLTGENGCVEATGTVTEADLHPGDGSYIVNAYIGGRLLNSVRVLPDSI